VAHLRAAIINYKILCSLQRLQAENSSTWAVRLPCWTAKKCKHSGCHGTYSVKHSAAAPSAFLVPYHKFTAAATAVDTPVVLCCQTDLHRTIGSPKSVLSSDLIEMKQLPVMPRVQGWLGSSLCWAAVLLSSSTFCRGLPPSEPGRREAPHICEACHSSTAGRQ
jgi:hypothetical protein